MYDPTSSRLSGSSQDADNTKIRLLSELVEQGITLPTNAATASKQDTLITLEQYQVWEFIPGNSKVITYFPETVQAANPSGNINVATIEFKTGNTTIITQSIAYDLNDNILSITAS